MRFWIEVSSATGTRTGRVDNALYWRHTARLDRAGTFEFAIPAADAKSTLIVNQQRVFCYGLVNGVITEIGAGIVERIVTQQSGSAPAVTVVSGDDVLRELAIHEIMGSPSTPVYPGPLQTDTIPDYLIGNATTPDFPGDWTLGGATTTQSDIYIRFGGESIFYLLTRVAQVTGEHFRYGGSRTLTWLGPVSTFAASGVLATSNADPAELDGVTTTCLITQIEEELDSHAQCNFLVVTGAGTGEVPLTLAAAENWPPGLVDDTSGNQTITWTANVGFATDGDGDEWWCERIGATYLTNRTRWAADGRLVRFAQFKDIAPLSNTSADFTAAADYLLQAAYHELRTRTTAQRAYRLAITGLETALQVGTTLAVQARAVTEDDSGTKRTYINIERDDLIVLETETQIDAAGIRTVGVTVSTADRWPDSNEQAVIERLNEGHTSLILPQLGVSVDTTRFQEAIDDSYSASLYFWLSDYVTLVNQVIIRFRVDPLRSTVKNITGGSGGSSAPTSGASSASSSGSSSEPGTTGTNLAAGDPHSHNFTTPAHAHTIAHTHIVTIAAHTHSSTGVYGVYEESGANTYAYSDLEFEVNGSAATNSPAAVSGASGWYSIDLTVDLVDSVNRPLSAANVVTVAVKAASMADKSVQVTAEIERRVTIQSIATV